jgi:hypothetical protein
MPRTDVKTLSFLELDAFVESAASQAQAVAAAQPDNSNAAAPAPVAEPAPLVQCPHCGGRLSALDVKFGQCLTCHKSLSAGGPAADAAARKPVSIGI